MRGVECACGFGNDPGRGRSGRGAVERLCVHACASWMSHAEADLGRIWVAGEGGCVSSRDERDRGHSVAGGRGLDESNLGLTGQGEARGRTGIACKGGCMASRDRAFTHGHKGSIGY